MICTMSCFRVVILMKLMQLKVPLYTMGPATDSSAEPTRPDTRGSIHLARIKLGVCVAQTHESVGQAPKCRRTLQFTSPRGGGGPQSPILSAFVVPAWTMLPEGV